MKKSLAFWAFLNLGLLSPASHACSCLGIAPPSTDWVRTTAKGSSYVFFGTVESVTPVKYGDTVHVRIEEHLKGNSTGLISTNTMCPNFVVKSGDKRVFFVMKDGTIAGCSDYKYYFTDWGILKELRQVLRPGT